MRMSKSSELKHFTNSSRNLSNPEMDFKLATKKKQKSASHPLPVTTVYNDSGAKSTIRGHIHLNRDTNSCKSSKVKQEKFNSGKSNNLNERFRSNTSMPYLDKALQDIEASIKLKQDKYIPHVSSHNRNSASITTSSVTRLHESRPVSTNQDCMEYESKSFQDTPSEAINFKENEIEEEAKKVKASEVNDKYSAIISQIDGDVSLSSALMHTTGNFRNSEINYSRRSESPYSNSTFTSRFGRLRKEESTEFRKENTDWDESLSSGSGSFSGWSLFGNIQKDMHYNGSLSSALNLNCYGNNGILTDQIIATSQSCLSRCPESQKYVYTKLELQGKNLCDISVLQFYRYLQYIDLSWNKLEDVTALGYVRYLTYLDVSHNHLTNLLDFRPPFFLTHVNYSFNTLEYIKDLSDFWSIKILNLSNNSIKKIEGLQNLRYLLELNLSFNEITKIENLNSLLRIVVLNLDSNRINEYEEDLKSLQNLKHLSLNNNKLESLDFLHGVSTLHYLYMQNNKLSQLSEVETMKCLMELEALDFTNNDIATWPKYRDLVIFILPSLVILDSLPVSAIEKVRAKITFEILDGTNGYWWNHVFLILRKRLQSPAISLDVTPIDQPPYPFIILVGPVSSGKSYLLNRMLNELGEKKVYIGIHHTTLPHPTHEEIFDRSYFISDDKFLEMANKGEFLTFVRDMGHYYGFSHREVEKAIEKGVICLTDMWLTEVMTMYPFVNEPCFILTIPESEKLHRERFNNDFHIQRMSSVRVGAGALEVTHILHGIHEVSSACTLIAHEILEETLRVATKETKLSEMSLVAENDSNRSILTSEKIMDLHGIVSGTSIKGMMIGSFQNGKKIRISDVSSHSSEDMKEFKERLLANIRGDNKRESASGSSSLIDLVTTSSNSKQNSVSEFSSLFYSRTDLDLESFSSSSDKLSFLGHQLDVITEETETFTDKSILDYDHKEKELEKSEEGVIVEQIHSPMYKLGTIVRESYFNFHKQNPGFFDFVIYTDDLEKASHQLKKYLKYYFSESMKKHSDSLKQDPLYHQIVKEKVEKFTSEINRNRFTMAEQQFELLHSWKK